MKKFVLVSVFAVCAAMFASDVMAACCGRLSLRERRETRQAASLVCEPVAACAPVAVCKPVAVCAPVAVCQPVKSYAVVRYVPAKKVRVPVAPCAPVTTVAPCAPVAPTAPADCPCNR